MSELDLSLSLELLLTPIANPEGPERDYMVYAYRKLSSVLKLDSVNEISRNPDFDALFWKDENEMVGPACGNCDNQTTPILYGMPGEDFDFDRFEVGGCIVSESDPVWLCRKCGWQI